MANSRDQHAWLRRMYTQLAETSDFRQLAPDAQFRRLCEAIAKENPSYATHLREWPRSAILPLLGWLADPTSEEEPHAPVEIWRVSKDDRELV